MPHGQDNESLQVIVTGGRGDGKTFLSELIRQLLEEHGARVDVFSTHHIAHDHEHKGRQMRENVARSIREVRLEQDKANVLSGKQISLFDAG